MTLQHLTHPLNGLLMLALPILLGIWLTRRFKLGWRIWWIGAATFVLSQVGHIPFNLWFFGLFNKGVLKLPGEAWELPVIALLAGLSAGIFEECARYLAYRFWAKDARTWGKGILLGAGHGGSEAIIFGALVLYTFFYMLAIQGQDLSALVPTEQLSLAEQQVSAYWNTPLGMTLLGAVERALTIPFHIACSVLVLQVFRRKQIGWLFLAIAYHAFVDAAIPGYAAPKLMAYPWGAYALEGLLALTVPLDLLIIFKLRSSEPESAPAELPPLPQPASALDLGEVQETPESLEKSRYNSGR
jgi:uncharacterized membrane protein YhfC